MPEAQTMKALRLHGPRDLRLEEAPRPGKPSGCQVKVRVAAAGICGTDLHVYETGAYVARFPVTMGHEFSGTVIDAGSGANGLEPGDRVVGDSRVSCGECEFCAKGLPNLCVRLGFIGEVREGAFAEEILIEETSLVRVGPSVPFEIAALAEPLAVALHAAGQAGSGSKDGKRTLILGAGPMGALVYETLRLQGHPGASIADRSSYRRGIMETAHPGSVTEPEGRFDLVFETTGSPQVAQALLPMVMAKQGTLVMVGLFGEAVPFELTALIENEWNVRGCAAFSGELGEAARLLERHPRAFSHVVSHRLPLASHARAFDLLRAPEKEAMKVVFEPHTA